MQIVIASPAAPATSVVQPTCTVATGTITITSSTAGLTFSLDGGAYAAYPAGGYVVAAGAHTLTTQNAAGCISAVTSITVNAQPVTPAAPTIETIMQPTCAISTGSVVLGGLPFGNWTINPGALIGNTATTTLNGFAQGTYNFTVTNSESCISPASADVVISNVPGAPPPPTVNIVHPTCTVATGTITITSTTSGLTLSLDGGAYAAYPVGGYVAAAGAHTLTVQNTAFCTSPITNITINPQPQIPAAPTVSIVHPTCTVVTGTITITSPTTGLTFSLNGGAYVTYPASGYVVATGVHSLTAQYASGCISTVTNITVNPQPVSTTASVSAGSIACFGGSTTLAVTASGGPMPFEYSLNDGSFQSGNTFIVNAGTHTVTVRNANFCTTTTAVTVTQPAAFTAAASTSIIGCQGGTTTLIASARGGTGTLLYSLNGGTFQSGNAFIVGAGTYTVTVKDVNNCTAVTTAITIIQPATLTASATANRIIHCGGITAVTVAASGGITPYTSGVGTFTRGPGTWIFTVSDAGGCTDTTQVTIEAPGCMDLKVYPNPASNFINVYHSTAASGSSMQVFSINGALVLTKQVPQNAFQTTIDTGRLPAGSYLLVYLNGIEKKQTLFEKITTN